MVVLKDRIEEIEINRIAPLNERRHDKNRIKELAESIENYDLIIPITVIKEEDGTYSLCKGQGRIEAFKLLNENRIKAFVYNKNEVDRKTVIKWWLIENEVREKLSEYDKAYLMSLDYDLLGEEETAKKYKLRPTTVRQYKKTMDRITPKIREKVKDGNVSFTLMKETLSAIKDSKSAEEVVDYISEEKLDFEEGRAAIAMAKKLIQENKAVSMRELKESFRKLSEQNKLLRPVTADLRTKYDFITEWLSILLKDDTFVSLLKEHNQRIPQNILDLNVEV
ncbi:MAG TPA: ParB/RepB/Spo0J family partition protein [candidate division Zixibacteria bacterium]